MKKLFALSALSAALICPAIAHAQAASAPAASATVIATVGGKPIMKSRVDDLFKRSSQGGNSAPRTPEMEKRAADQVVTEELFVQEAVRRGIATSPEYLEQIEAHRRDLLARALFTEFRKTLVSEDELKAEYEKLKSQNTGLEYRARHILVPKEADAKGLIAQLKKGASFEELAKKHSKDTGADKTGGDLDWAPANAYEPDFSAAMMKLKKGGFTDTPVKTQYGYHIIKLEDTRAGQMPPLEAVRDQLVQRLEQKNFKDKFTAFREELRKKMAADYQFSE